MLQVKNHVGSLGHVKQRKGAQLIHSHVVSPLDHFGEEAHDMIKLQDQTMFQIESMSDSVDVEVFSLELGHTVEFNQSGEEGDNGELMTSDIFANVPSDFGRHHHRVFVWIVCGVIGVLARSVSILMGICDGTVVIGGCHGEASEC